MSVYRPTEGWNRLTVDPDLSNQPGIEFWRRMGFVPVQVMSDDIGRESYMLMERIEP